MEKMATRKGLEHSIHVHQCAPVQQISLNINVLLYCRAQQNTVKHMGVGEKGG